MPRPKKSIGSIELVIRNRESGKIGPRKCGRAPVGVEIGYMTADGQFHPGNPRKRRRRRGRKSTLSARRNGANTGRKPSAGGLGEIEMIVRREVEARLGRAKQAAVDAIEKALGV